MVRIENGDDDDEGGADESDGDDEAVEKPLTMPSEVRLR